jgi:hypothetical protein
MRTVKRNSIEAREMWGRVTRARSFTLDNYFNGSDVSVERAKSWYDKVGRTGHTSIIHDGTKYVIHYHSNHWTELS